MPTTLTRTVVNGPIETNLGEKPANGRFYMALRSADREGDTTVIPNVTEVALDADGDFSQSFWSNLAGDHKQPYAAWVTWWSESDHKLKTESLGYVSVPTSGGPYALADLWTDDAPDFVPGEILSVMEGLLTDAEEAADRAEAVAPFATRASFVAWVAAGNVPVNGREYRAGGVSYIGSTGASHIADLPGVVPNGDATFAHWGVTSASSPSAASAGILAALQYGGVVSSGGCGEIITNQVSAALTRDTYLRLEAGDSIKGVALLAAPVIGVSGIREFSLFGGGTVDTSATFYGVGVSSGTGLDLGTTLKKATIWNIHFFAGAAKQSTNGDSGISGTCSDVTITGCTFTGHPDAGIYHAGTATNTGGFYSGPLGQNWKITGNTFRHCHTACTSKRNSWGGVFSGNTVEWCEIGFSNLSAVSGSDNLAPGKGWQITGNQFRKMRSRALELRAETIATVSDNVIVDFGRNDDGTAVAGSTFGIYIRGGQNISGKGNIITFEEWATHSGNTGLRIERWVFDQGGPNETTFDPDNLDFGVAILGVHTTMSFGSTITGPCNGRLTVTARGATTVIGGTVPAGLLLNTLTPDDWALRQGSDIAFRAIAGKLGNGTSAQMDATLSLRSVDALGSADNSDAQMLKLFDEATGRMVRVALRRTAAEGGTTWHNTALRIESNVNDVDAAQSWVELINGTSTSANTITMGFGTAAPTLTLNSTLFASAVPVQCPTFTVAGLPAAGGRTGAMVYVSNEAGGAVMAFSDGTNWRRVTDRAVVS